MTQRLHQTRSVIAADLQAVAAGIELLTHGLLRGPWLAAAVTVALVGFQLVGKYATLFKTFKWLTLSLFAYVGAALLSHAHPLKVLSLDPPTRLAAMTG